MIRFIFIFTIGMMISGLSFSQNVPNYDFTHDIIRYKESFRNQAKYEDDPYFSGPIHKGARESFELDLTGVESITFKTEGYESSRGVHSFWGRVKLFDQQGKSIWLDDLEIYATKSGWKPVTKNANLVDGDLLSVDGEKIEHGVIAHASGSFTVDIGGKYARMEGFVGLDDIGSAENAVGVFQVNLSPVEPYIEKLRNNHPKEMDMFERSGAGNLEEWFKSDNGLIEKGACLSLVDELKDPAYYHDNVMSLSQYKGEDKAVKYLRLYEDILNVLNLQKELEWLNVESLQLALEDMKVEFPDAGFGNKIKKLNKLQVEFASLEEGLYAGNRDTMDSIREWLEFKKSVLLSHPELANASILATKHDLGYKARKVWAPYIGTPPNNWSSNSSIVMPRDHQVEIVMLTDLASGANVETVYAPEDDKMITDLDLHWDANRLLFSTVNERDRWHVYELDLNTKAVERQTSEEEPDIDYFEGIYLPNGKIMTASTLGYNGVPCVDGSDAVANLTLVDPKEKSMRRLNFGQDNDWDPVVLDNGRIMYLRWEYTDNTHYFSRVLMHMNPDGTGKKEYYGGNSYWPNSMFDARQLPGKGNQEFVAVVSGHHGIARSGRLVLFDPAKGRHEDQGVVQEIPFRNRKVVPEIKDELVNDVWPQFLKPYPVTDKYFLVTAKLRPDALWGLYLVDVFDNVTLIKEFEKGGISEATILKKRNMPPAIPEKIKSEDKEATVYIQDIYEGRGLPGVPKGTVKELRIVAYEYAYRKSKSDHDAHGIQSGWDMKRVLGTVPIEEDGSAMFKIPANTPITLQPLDEEGRAVQLMRSWLTGMPGEVVSCVGCHEEQNSVPLPKPTIASRRKPNKIDEPSDGVHPFTFNLDVQPILDRKCGSCHDGKKDMLDFVTKEKVEYNNLRKSYLALHPFVNRQGPEADIHVMKPMEYHASTSELIKILKKGHYNVELDSSEWNKLYTWIDLNAPYHGEFKNVNTYANNNQISRRQELAQKYSNVEVDWQEELTNYEELISGLDKIAPIMPKAEDVVKTKKVKVKNWPMDLEQAQKLQQRLQDKELVLEIGNGMSIKFVKIPKGEFAMGSNQGRHDEMPKHKVEIEEEFWMGQLEISNAQYKAIVPEHDSRYIAQQWKDHVNPGYPANKDNQPVIRVSWEEAMDYCEKLSEITGYDITLPTEAQWEWASRSGSANDMWFFDLNKNYGKYENLADSSLADMAVIGVDPQPMASNDPRRKYWDFLPRNASVDDGNMIVAEVGEYLPNPWGLYDMHGNVAEWTLSDYKPYPYMESDGRNNGENGNMKVARGGSWKDRQKNASASTRNSYESWQKVSNVGFRLVINMKSDSE
ncbi:SUMF1/EgtB/PvdO family nonheme iron enzyme [Aureibacter tunicatorum]|uniref:Formylglycine-generating enzyme required for sulfatase activity n=1 Tax=Aureibacter tunicatorum TaxID=866807 RepID=A0AAE3XT99_9BACT|nr:SUMF1/EgtB/PvdO family nonheme iron enzyme [Aureibacter tunicatorum]MDR6241605.1 formylglycine-generating enzyme required for sulfatase activity [Aureibacter tunicatorum]